MWVCVCGCVRVCLCACVFLQPAGPWLVNDVTSPEVEELMTAFESMSTVVKFANMSLSSGEIDVAQQNYIEAKVLFTKLGNDRGVSIVHNNLGNVFTLQARELAAQAAAEASQAGQEGNNSSREKAEKLIAQADKKFDDAAKNFRLAIEDAEMLCSEKKQHDNEEIEGDGELKADIENAKVRGGAASAATAAAAAVGGSRKSSRIISGHGHYRHPDDDLSSPAALSLQLANRKLNLALCLAAKGNSAVPMGGSPDLNAINEARRLLHECAKLAADREDAKGDQRHVECLIEVAKLERTVPDRNGKATEALDRAQAVVIGYHGSGGGGGSSNGRGNGSTGGRVSLGIVVPPPEGLAPPPPLGALRQQVLAARGEHCVAYGDPKRAVEHWADALIGCGDRMDVGAVRASLTGLRQQAKDRITFPESLLVALGFQSSQLRKDGRVGTKALVAAVDKALEKLDSEAKKCGNVEGRPATAVTRVDLCFVMDCTRSVS